MKKRPTIRDVAGQAGVSIATVSKFINGTQRFSAAVERRIQAAIDELAYHSNPLARSMITGKTGSIGVVTARPLSMVMTMFQPMISMPTR